MGRVQWQGCHFKPLSRPRKDENIRNTLSFKGIGLKI
jgi:hypothetical protein